MSSEENLKPWSLGVQGLCSASRRPVQAGGGLEFRGLGFRGY